MYFLFLIWFLPLVTSLVSANPNSSQSFVSSLALRQIGPSSSATDCNATCNHFQEVQDQCNSTPHNCVCTTSFLQAQGDCLLCHASTVDEGAMVQLLLNEEMAGCNDDLQFDLPPADSALIQKFNRDSAVLRRTQMAYLGLQVAGGHIGLVVVLVHSIFSNRIRRDPTYINFCITWIFSSVAFSLLLYHGSTGNTTLDVLSFLTTLLVLPVTPSQSMCKAQAVLIEGAQVMTTASTLALIVQLWLSLRIAVYGDTYGPKRTRWTTGVLLVIPYILFLAFALPSVFVGRSSVALELPTVFVGTERVAANNLLRVQRAFPTNFYCMVVGLNPFLQAVYSVSVVLLTLTAIFDALILIMLYKNWRGFRQLKAKSAVSLSVLFRYIGFSIYRLVVAAAYVSVISRLPELNTVLLSASLRPFSLVPIWVDMLQATIPCVAVLALGINKDLIDSMMFWRWFRAKH